jgi:hypothetical protein
MNSTNRSIRTLFLASTVLLSNFTFAPWHRHIGSAVAQEGEPRSGDEEDSEVRREFDEMVRNGERQERLSRVLEITAKLRITQGEFIDFFDAQERAGKRTESSDLAWAKLLSLTHVPMRADVTEADFESAQIAGDTAGAFMRMKLHIEVDNLRISPEELATIQTNWTLQERRDFAKVIQRAAEIVGDRGTAKPQEAYERALREFAERAFKCPK